MTTGQNRTLASGLLAGGFLVAVLTGCSDADDTASTAVESAGAAAESAGAAAESAAESAGEAAESAATAAESAVQDVQDNVDCSGTSCTVTISAGGQVDVLGNELSFEGVENGEATLNVAGNTATCTQGESVSAGPLSLECTTVSEDGVTLTATLG